MAKTIVAPPADRGALNGSPASDAARFTGHRHRTVTTSFRGRRLRVRGRLVGPDGKPIAGARIDVLSQLHRAGARFRAVGSTRTSRKGGFSFKAPPGASRTLRFGYRSHVNDTAFTTTLDVLQRVRASATLHASRRSVPRGGSVTFRGRLRGGYVPPRGKLVELQATDSRTLADVRARTLEPQRRVPLPLPLRGLGAVRVPRPRALRARLSLRARLQLPHVRPGRLSAVQPAGVARRARGRYPSAVDQ